MNKLLKIKFAALLVLLCTYAVAQDEAPELLLNVSYHSEPSGMQYLKVNTRAKENNKLVNVPGVKVVVYLDSISTENIIGEVTTSVNGEAGLFIPAKFKEQWKQSSTHTFKAVSAPIAKMAEATTDLSITRGKIEIDTLFEDDVRSIKVTVLKQEGTEWLPAGDVEVTIGIKRYSGELPISDEENYTTDSLGELVAEFKRDSVPTDSSRNIELIARITDNDLLGNMYVTKSVPWGVQRAEQGVNHGRTLWATRDRAPIWLLLMAYFIIAVVWGTLLYLVYLLVRIVRNRDVKEDKALSPVAETEGALT